jgi:hypothetical protein
MQNVGRLGDGERAVLWFTFGVLVPALPVIMALFYLGAVGGLSIGSVGGSGQFLIACVGVSAGTVAEVFARGLPRETGRRFRKVVAAVAGGYLALLSAGLYGIFGLHTFGGSQPDPDAVARMSLGVLGAAGAAGLFAAIL